MSKPRDFICKCSSLKDALAALGRIPSILNQAFSQWGSVDIVVREHKEPRSLDQNRLQRLWCKEAAQQLEGHTAEDWRAHCKLHFGIPILRRDCEEFREVYDRLIRPRPYEEKLEIMKEPIDFQVTRIMNKPQKSEYLQLMWEFFTGEGAQLTDPSMMGREKYREAA
ncbi:hypothetical protein LMG33818_000020 [Halomonadaceae bacterium LMG 33818]|uniref:hypothetical protein n=1 Tax=Cernens ardua TaxID=3402176 RepID=UPI003EDBDB85